MYKTKTVLVLWDYDSSYNHNSIVVLATALKIIIGAHLDVQIQDFVYSL